MKENKLCLCCCHKIKEEKPRICPIPSCKHVFKGKGWEGIDAHWKAKHGDVMPYADFWNSLCHDHKNIQRVIPRTADNSGSQ